MARLDEEQGTPEAYRQLKRDIQNNFRVLVPYVMTFKDVLGAIADIDDRIKGNQRRIGRSAEQVLREYLNTGTVPTEIIDPSEHLKTESIETGVVELTEKPLDNPGTSMSTISEG